MSGAGAFYGKFTNHVAALASTMRERAPIEEVSAPLGHVAEYERRHGLLPYRVIRDMTVNRPYGRFAVYVGGKRIGAQLSFPSSSDCERMENPPAVSAPYEVRLSKGARMARGVMTPAEAAEKKAKNKASYERKKKAHQRIVGGRT